MSVSDTQGGAGGWRHEMSGDPLEGSYCRGYTSVSVPLSAGPCIYTVRCEEPHQHQSVVCIDPAGRRRTYDIRERHTHPGNEPPFKGLSGMWGKAEFERVRVPQLQRKYGEPLPPRMPDPPKPQPRGFKPIAAGLTPEAALRVPERPPVAEVQPDRTNPEDFDDCPF